MKKILIIFVLLLSACTNNQQNQITEESKLEIMVNQSETESVEPRATKIVDSENTDFASFETTKLVDKEDYDVYDFQMFNEYYQDGSPTRRVYDIKDKKVYYFDVRDRSKPESEVEWIISVELINYSIYDLETQETTLVKEFEDNIRLLSNQYFKGDNISFVLNDTTKEMFVYNNWLFDNEKLIYTRKYNVNEVIGNEAIIIDDVMYVNTYSYFDDREELWMDLEGNTKTITEEEVQKYYEDAGTAINYIYVYQENGKPTIEFYLDGEKLKRNVETDYTFGIKIGDRGYFYDPENVEQFDVIDLRTLEKIEFENNHHINVGQVMHIQDDLYIAITTQEKAVFVRILDHSFEVQPIDEIEQAIFVSPSIKDYEYLITYADIYNDNTDTRLYLVLVEQ